MKDYSNFIPKNVAVLVGNVEMEVSEYTIAKRDAAMKIMLSSLDIATLVKPFLDAARMAKNDQEITVDLTLLINQAKDILIRMLGSDLTSISCLTLDTAANRKTLISIMNQPQINDTVNDSKYGFAYSPMMYQWISDNLTARQEYNIIQAVFEINDFVGLVKNYSSLAMQMVQSARAKKVIENQN